MKNYLKSQLKNLPMILIISIVFCGVNTLATSYLFKAKEVEFDNSNTNIESTNVGDAIDELYTAANNFATYDTRLQGVENTIGTGSLTTTNNTLIGGINELNNKLTSKADKIEYTTKTIENQTITSGLSGNFTIPTPTGYTYSNLVGAWVASIPSADANFVSINISNGTCYWKCTSAGWQATGNIIIKFAFAK